MGFPLFHPPMIIRDAMADSVTERDQFTQHFIITRIAKHLSTGLSNKIKRMLKYGHKSN